MNSTDLARAPNIPARLKDRFEELRGAYYARLAGDRGKLMELLAAFPERTSPAPRPYERVQQIAHGMSGAAAVFEAHQVASVARHLEQTARAAIQSPSAPAEAAVREALVALVDLLLTVSA